MSVQSTKYKKRAFTLTELLVGLIICAIIILIIGSIAGIAMQSYEKARSESEVYNDLIYYGIELIKNSVRQAHSVTIATASSLPGTQEGTWINPVLIADNHAFAVFQPADKQTKDLVFLADKNLPNARNIILFAAEDINLVLVQESGSLYNITIQGSKRRNSFDLSTSITKRN